MELTNIYNRIVAPTFGLKPGLPSEMHIAINSVCNARCIMCDIGQRMKDTTFSLKLLRNHEMSVKEFDVILSKVPFIKVVHINGTEPLLHTDITGIIKKCQEYGFKCRLTTNGFLLDSKVDELLSLDLDEIYLSIDGYPGLNDEIRGVPGGTNHIISVLDDVSSTFDTSISSVILPQNQSKLYETVAFYTDFPIKRHDLVHMTFITKHQAELHNKLCAKYSVTPSVTRVNPTQIDPSALHCELKRILDDFDHVIIYPDIFEEKEIKQYYSNDMYVFQGRKCVAPWTVFQVLPDGNISVSSRCFVYDVGNIFRQNFREIWYGPKYTFLRKGLRKGAFPACYRCCSWFSKTPRHYIASRLDSLFSRI